MFLSTELEQTEINYSEISRTEIPLYWRIHREKEPLLIQEHVRKNAGKEVPTPP